MPRTLSLTPHETVTHRKSTPELAGGRGMGTGGPPPSHVTPSRMSTSRSWRERYRRIDGEERDLAEGDIDYPAARVTDTGTWRGPTRRSGRSVRR